MVLFYAVILYIVLFIVRKILLPRRLPRRFEYDFPNNMWFIIICTSYILIQAHIKDITVCEVLMRFVL